MTDTVHRSPDDFRDTSATALAPLRSVELEVTGMTCASCAARIEKKLNRLEGVSATVNYATEKASVQFGGTTTPQTLIETIERTGYGASLPSEGEHDPDHDVRMLGRRTPRGRPPQPAGDRAGHGSGLAVRGGGSGSACCSACRWSAGRAGPSTPPQRAPWSRAAPAWTR
jgi:copper chaperone CopZ